MTTLPLAPWVPEQLPTETFAQRIKLLRLWLDLSQDAMARRVGVDGQSWRNWEGGTEPRGLLRVIEKIVAATGVDQAWLTFGSSSNTGPGGGGATATVSPIPG